MAAVRHFGVLKLKFLTAIHLRDMYCIIVPNSVQTDRTVAEMSKVFAVFSEM